MEAKRLKAPEKAKVRRALEALGSTEDLAKIRHKDLVQRIKAVVGFDVSISSIKGIKSPVSRGVKVAFSMTNISIIRVRSMMRRQSRKSSESYVRRGAASMSSLTTPVWRG